jgi:hypothetical protein
MVDVLAGFLLLVLTVSGGIIRWYLPPGSGHAEGGRSAKLLLGMNRHAWGDIHFWLSVGFLICMIVHLYQHRYWVKARLGLGNAKATLPSCPGSDQVQS